MGWGFSGKLETDLDFGFNPPSSINFNPDALNYFANTSPEPSTAVKVYYNTLINSLQAGSNNWAQLLRLLIFSSEFQDNANTSIVNPTSTKVSPIGSPTWTQFRDYQGTTNKYLNLNFNPTNDGGSLYTLNNAGISLYARTTTGNTSMGCDETGDPSISSTILSPPASSGQSSGQINDETGVSSVVNVSALGLHTILRTDANTTSIYRNGVLLNTNNSNPSTFLPNLNMFGLSINADGSPTGFGTKRVGAMVIHSGNINVLELYNSIQAFMTSVGAAV